MMRDREQRFAAYQAQMRTYNRLKPFFVRGQFHGIAEHVHLHTLRDVPGGVLNVFNLADHEQTFEFDVPRNLLGTTKALPVQGAGAAWGKDAVRLNLSLPGMCPAVIEIGIL